MSDGPVVGEEWRGNEVLAVRDLSLDGWLLYKIPGSISDNDFIVKVINPDHPIGISVQHAHFAIDLYGKLTRDADAGMSVFEGIIDVWHDNAPDSVIDQIEDVARDLPGYDVEYFLLAYDWILDQEDINYAAGDPRSDKKQGLIDATLEDAGVAKASGRKGSQLAISLLSDIVNGKHPVEALRSADLEIKPRRWS